jgi:adenylate cyclase
MEYLASQVGIILRNTMLYEAQIASQMKVQALLDIVRSLHGDMGINSLLFTLTERTPQLIEADRCTVFLVDVARKELTSMHGAVEIRIGMDKGIAGEVATHNKTVNIPDAYKDPRFNQAIDKQSGYHTKTILCLPIRDAENKPLGVIQLINKKHGAFSKEDEELLEGFLGIAGSILQTSQLFAHNKEKVSEFQQAMAPATRATSNKMTSNLGVMEEGDGDDSDADDDF